MSNYWGLAQDGTCSDASGDLQCWNGLVLGKWGQGYPYLRDVFDDRNFGKVEKHWDLDLRLISGCCYLLGGELVWCMGQSLNDVGGMG